MTTALGVGDALLIPSGPDDHMFVILATAYYGKPHETHLIANFSSVKAGLYHDPACIVEGGVHPFLTRRSFVFYREARIEFSSDLAARLKSGKYQPLVPVSARLLGLMRAGISKSSHIVRKNRNYFHDHGGS
jgi:hypothetical protein